VTGPAADGSSVAFAVARQPGDCFHVAIGNRSTGHVGRLGQKRGCGPATSMGSGLVGPVLAGGRALWVTYAGGNFREYSLWTATSRRPKPASSAS
jgi:hypothetical protein